MAEHPAWFVGNRDPSITETIIDSAGAAVDLNSPASTVKFKAREVGSSTLLVDAAATIVQSGSGSGATDKGAVRYDWTASDASSGALSTARDLLVWWEVTRTGSGNKQDYMEAIVRVLAHAPETNAYVEVEELKSTAELTGTTFADRDIEEALVTASRVIDEETGRRFYPDADANQIRYYTPVIPDELWIDDLIALTSLQTAPGSDLAFTQTWASTDYILEPRNAVADGTPYSVIRVAPAGAYSWPTYPNSVKVTGKFGWASAPLPIKFATKTIATQLLKRMREAPFGIVAIGLEGAAVRISRSDPQVQAALRPYMKPRSLVA